MRRYTVLLQIAQTEKLSEMLAKMPDDVLRDPILAEVVKLAGAFRAKDWSSFFNFYRKCDFLSAVCLAGVVGCARFFALGVTGNFDF